MNIFVAGLPYDLDDAELMEIFEKFGEVKSAKVAMDRETGKSRGFAFVDMPVKEEAMEAISGNLCRCTGYHNIVKSVALAAQTMKGGK